MLVGLTQILSFCLLAQTCALHQQSVSPRALPSPAHRAVAVGLDLEGCIALLVLTDSLSKSKNTNAE